MRTRALVIAAALVAGSAATGLAATVSAAPSGLVGAAGSRVQPQSSAPSAHAPMGWRRDDFRTAASLRAARIRMLSAQRLAARPTGLAAADPQPVYAYGDIDAALPDVDGDGVGDILSSRRAGRTPALKVLSGRTGRALWSVSATTTYAAVYVPAPGGKSLMLLLSDVETGQDTPVGGASEDVFTVKAVNPKTGASLWSTSITGAIEDDPSGLRVAGAGELDGVIMRKGTTPYLLLDRFTLVGGFTLTTAIAPIIVDAANGNVVRPESPLGGDDFTFAIVVGDLDADGVGDYLIIAQGDVPTVGARSGATGQPLWNTETSKNAWLISLAASPDLSGDHHPDLLLGWWGVDANVSTVHAVNGATGADVWTAAGDYAMPLGDLDRDGRSDTRVVAESARITITATSATGKRLWSRDILTPSGTRGLVWDAGDLDGDRYGDTYVEFAPNKENSPPKSADIVTGRTGASRGTADLGWALGVSLRGGAPSFVRAAAAKKGFAVTAYDGRTHGVSWRTVVKTSDVQRMSTLDVVDLGHGRVGLLTLLTGRFTDTIALFDGRRGTILWTSVYDTTPQDVIFF